MKPLNASKPPNSESRIGDLSVLPVFLDLHGKHAVAFGASQGLLWKADLLLSAGAKLTLVVPGPSADVLNLVSRRRDASLLVATWQDSGVTEADIIVADVDEHEANPFFSWAIRLTDFVNIVDKPEFCRFQFGSIVNRSPVVVGISTAGAAPVLAQKLRTLVESMLPNGLANITSHAQSIRFRVNARLPTPEARRRYWHAFFGRIFGLAAKDHHRNDQAYDICIASVEDLTLRDIRQLQSAELVILGGGVDPRVKTYMRREAKCIERDQFSDIGASAPGTVFVTLAMPKQIRPVL